MQTTGFEWDAKKDENNREKHGISFYEAQYAFFDPNRIIAEDLKHCIKEKRYFCIGKIETGVITVRFTYRDNIIRIIGAGYWRKGKHYYEEKNKVHR